METGAGTRAAGPERRVLPSRQLLPSWLARYSGETGSGKRASRLADTGTALNQRSQRSNRLRNVSSHEPAHKSSSTRSGREHARETPGSGNICRSLKAPLRQWVSSSSPTRAPGAGRLCLGPSPSSPAGDQTMRPVLHGGGSAGAADTAQQA